MNYTIPTIVTTDDLSKRSYVTFYYNDNRVRKYNGDSLGMKIEPNRAKSISSRNELLEKLRYEYHKSLEAGTYGSSKENKLKEDAATTEQFVVDASESIVKHQQTEALFREALNEKLSADLSRTYKRDLTSIHDKFIAYLTMEEKQGPLARITTVRVQRFLGQFGSTGTYYMNKRRNLAVLFNVAAALENQQLKTIKATSRRKAKAKLHEKYEKHQLKPILDYLKEHHYNLYICCLLTYCSWLRPHEEIRLLTPHDFRKGLTEIHLTGAENKGGQVRVVHVPEYARTDISKMLCGLQRNDNIFSRSETPFNESYFNTAWSRAFEKMYKLGLIQENQTIYSFRHTAAVTLYRKTKDVYLLQKLLGHSSLIVTLKYLRSLGEINSEELKQAAPTLD